MFLLNLATLRMEIAGEVWSWVGHNAGGPNIRLKLTPRRRVLFGNCGLVFQLSLRYTRQGEAGQLSRETLGGAS